MSFLNNDARRHRQFLKKRVANEFNVNEFNKKRSPPPSRIGNPPPATTDPSQGLPPVGSPQPTQPTDGPDDQGNDPPPRNPHSQPPVTNSPAQPTQPGQGPTHTTPTVPQVPVNTQPTSSLTTSSIPAISSTTLSSTTTSLTTLSTFTSPTMQFPTITNTQTSFSVPSFTDNGSTNTVSAPTTSATGTDDSSLSTGSVVGIVAASLIAVVAVIVVGMWLTKRYFKKRDEAEFNRNSFIRQSVHIPDGEDDYRSPRPPTMIERHNGAHSPQPYTNYGRSGMYPSVPPMPHIQPGEMMLANQAPVINPFAGSPADQYGMHPGPQQPALVRVPSNGSYNGGHGVHPGSPMSPHHDATPGQYQQYPTQIQAMATEEHVSPTQGPGHGYANLQRSSVTPYQAAQYAEISRQLNIPSVVNSPVSPSFAYQQGYGQHPGYGPAPGQEYVQPDISIDTGRLPTPAPPMAISPVQAVGPQRVMSPSQSQHAMSPIAVPLGGYSVPRPLNSGPGAPPIEAPASVAHAAAAAALASSAPRVATVPPAHVQIQPVIEVTPATTAPGQGHGEHLHPQAHGAHNERPKSAYDEEDAYGGM